jgi:hypothetical protein
MPLFTNPSVTPVWVKVNKTFADFSTPALTNTITGYTLPAAGVISGVKIKSSTAFTGGIISSYTISVGSGVSNSKYAPAFQMMTAVTATNYQLTDGLAGESQTASTAITFTATTTGDNLSSALTGVVDIWLLISFAA